MTPDDSASSLPVVTPPSDTESADSDLTVAGVLLAAGTSSRFGDANKLLASVAGDPLVRRAARPLVTAGLTPRVAVLGHDAERVRDALTGLGFRFAHNSDYRDGQATSVRTGVEALAGECVDGAIFALGDMPAVTPDTVRALVAAFRAGDGTALAAAYEGQRGNPVVFDARHFDALRDVTGDVGGREILLDGDASVLVATDDPGVLRDVDTPDDLA